mgnify:FL=1
MRFRTPRAAVKQGIAYVTEDRKADGFFETMSIGENIHMNWMAADLNPKAIVRASDAAKIGAEWVNALNIKAISAAAKVIELSGGNQQKVVIARALVQTPRVVIFDEPTRGVDVGAIADVHRIINELADRGIAVVVICSYLPEIMSLSDRILVTRQGRVVEEFSAEDAEDESIMFAAAH